jgi:hypothetical protein
MWPLRQQQRPLGSKGCVDPMARFLVLSRVSGRQACELLGHRNFRRSGGRSVRQDEKPGDAVSVGPARHKRLIAAMARQIEKEWEVWEECEVRSYRWWCALAVVRLSTRSCGMSSGYRRAGKDKDSK